MKSDTTVREARGDAMRGDATPDAEAPGGEARETWNGPFRPEAYEAARSILEADHARVTAELKQVSGKRARIVAAVAAIWAVCSVALALVNPNLLLVAEIGWAAVVIWAVFWMLPSLIGRANLDDVYEQYTGQIEALESRGIPMPQPSSIEDLVAAIDLVSPSADTSRE